MSQRKRRLAGVGFTLALTCSAALSACTGPGDPPAGTLSAPGSSTTGTTTPTGLPATASPGATGTGGTGASSLDPNAYQPATATSPAKNVPKPVMPEAAKKKDLEGQKAFIQYWISTYNYAFDTGVTGPLEEASTPACAFCSAASSGAKDMYTKASTWRVGGGSSIELIEALESTGNTATLAAKVVDTPARYFTASGPSAEYPAKPGATTDATLSVSWNGSEWRLNDVG